MTVWEVINAILRLVLTGLVIFKLSQFRELANVAERFGLGLMGGGSFLTVGILIEGPRSPFDGWAITVLTLGMVLLIGGRTWRDMKHQRDNARLRKEAERYLKARGKI